MSIDVKIQENQEIRLETVIVTKEDGIAIATMN